jgi:hypothetical protein
MSEQQKAPTPKQVDALIAEFAAAQSVALAAGAEAKARAAVADEVKARLTAMVEMFGARYAEKSKRLAGLRNTATTTTATRVTVDDKACDELRAYLDTVKLPGIAEKFFSVRTTYQLVASPAEVLKTLTLGARIRANISALVRGCFQVKVNSPSLKVDIAGVA